MALIGNATMNQGTPVSSPIRPYTALDTYAVALSDEIRGGLHAVDTTNTRNAISKDRRQIGMHCQVIDPVTKIRAEYVLINNPDTDATTDDDWAKCLVMSKEVLLADGKTSIDDVLKTLVGQCTVRKMVYVVGLSDIVDGPCPLEIPCGYTMTLGALLLTIPKGTVLTKALSANVEIYHGGSWNMINNLTIPIGGPDAVSVTLNTPFAVTPDDRVRLNFVETDEAAKCIVATLGFTEKFDATAAK